MDSHPLMSFELETDDCNNLDQDSPPVPRLLFPASSPLPEVPEPLQILNSRTKTLLVSMTQVGDCGRCFSGLSVPPKYTSYQGWKEARRPKDFFPSHVCWKSLGSQSSLPRRSPQGGWWLQMPINWLRLEDDDGENCCLIAEDCDGHFSKVIVFLNASSCKTFDDFATALRTSWGGNSSIIP